MQSSEAKLLEGKVLAAKIQDEIKAKIAAWTKQGKPCPALRAIQVGEDTSADWYLGQQEKLAAKLGIQYEKSPSSKTKDMKSLLAAVDDANRSKIHGVFITMPLPSGFNSDEILLRLDPKKDVEGIHPANLGLIVLRKSKLIPPTAYAALKLIESAEKNLKSKRAVIVGQSAIVGRPLQLLLGERRVTTTVCNTGTSAEETAKAVSESDIVVACAGNPGMVKGQWVKEGAIVIDVGTTEVAGKLTGDVEFEAAKKRASFITPVPGGVGPLTVTMLFQNLMNAYEWQEGTQ